MSARFLSFLLVLCSFIFLLFVAYLHLQNTLFESEYEVRSMHVACQLLTDYVKENKRWPQSWKDLFDSENAQALMSSFSVDESGMRKFVQVNFEYELCSQIHTHDFEGVKPAKGYYEYSNDVDFWRLHSSIKEACVGIDLDNKEVEKREPAPPKNE